MTPSFFIFILIVLFAAGFFAGFEGGYRYYDKKTREFYKQQNRNRSKF